MNQEKAEKQLRKHGLDLDSMSDFDIKTANANDIRDMDLSTLGTGLYSFGSLLSGNSDTSMIIDLLKAQIRQQWIIVRQNEQIIRLLSENDGAPHVPTGGVVENDAEGVDDSTDSMKLVRCIPATPTDAASNNIGKAVEVDGCNLLVGGTVVATMLPRMRDIMLSSMGRSGKAVLDKIDGKHATINVYA